MKWFLEHLSLFWELNSLPPILPCTPSLSSSCFVHHITWKMQGMYLAESQQQSRIYKPELSCFKEMRARFMGSDELGSDSSAFINLKIISTLLAIYDEIYDCHLIPFSIFLNWFVLQDRPRRVLYFPFIAPILGIPKRVIINHSGMKQMTELNLWNDFNLQTNKDCVLLQRQ